MHGGSRMKRAIVLASLLIIPTLLIGGAAFGQFSGLPLVPSAQTLIQPFIAMGGNTAISILTRAGWQLTPQDFGAVGDGATDDCVALTNAGLSIASTNATLFVPAKSYRSSCLVNFSGGLVQGFGFAPHNPPQGAMILCDVTVSPCVSLGGNNSTVSFRGVSVEHAGSPASTTIGLRVVDAYNVILENVMSYNSGICYQWLGHPSTGLGLGGQMTHTFSGACGDDHIDINGWPELRVVQSRFGMNGGGDLAANTFIRVEGGVGSTAGGPNTLSFDNSQFNQGSAAVAHFVEFVNLGAAGVPSIDATDFKFHGLHVENLNSAVFYSDASWNIVNRVNVSESSFNDSAIPFLSMNANTELSVWNIENNQIFGTLSATYGTTGNLNAFSLKNNLVQGAVTLTGPSTGGGTATASGNTFGAGLTIAGSWGDLEVGPDTFSGGTLTNNGSGNLFINEVQVQSSNGKMITFGSDAGGDQPLQITGGKTGQNPGTIQMTGGGVGLVLNAPNTIQIEQSSGRALDVNAAYVKAWQPLILQPYTVAALPTCNATLKYSIANVTDAVSPTYNGALTGGGTVNVLAFCNASGAWVSH